MATFQSNKVVDSIPARDALDGVQSVTGKYSLTAALVLNDVIQMVKIPAGHQVVDVILSADDLDTNGTPLISLTVGDGDDTARFIAASTIGRTGGVARLDQKAGLQKVYTAEDTVDVKVSAAPATGAVTGDITCTVKYTRQL